MSATVMSGKVASTAAVMGVNLAGAAAATTVADVELAASSAAAKAAVAVASVETEFEFAVCDCCGLTEECTLAYAALVRGLHGGRWICGLCAEAVKDEIGRSGLLLSPEEAVLRHETFCRRFRYEGAAAVDPTERFIATVRQILRRSLDSPRSAASNPGVWFEPVGNNGPRSGLGRTDSI